MIIDEQKIKTDPVYLASIINGIETRDDFKKIAPFLNSPMAANCLLMNANPKVFKYCQEEKVINSNKLFPKEEVNLLSNIIYLSLSDTSYLASTIIMSEKMSSLNELYPREVLSGIDQALQSDNTYSKSYFESEKKYVPLMVATKWDSKFNQQKISSAYKILQNYVSSEAALQMIIDERFPGAKLKDLNSKEKDLLKIILFFNCTPLVDEQLHKMELALREAAGDRWDKKSNKLQNYQEGYYLKHNKLLSDFLKEWAIDNGFKNWGKLSSSLTTDQFYSVLGSLALFKDKAFRQNKHAEFTHAIQLYCLIEYCKECKKKGEPFLSNDPVELIKWMPEEPDTGLKKKWDKTFDYNDPKFKRIRSDFTQPEYLTEYLLRGLPDKENNVPKFPILKQLTLGRMENKPRDLSKQNNQYKEEKPYDLKPLVKKGKI